MKKLFTLIAALAITSMANAQLQFKHGTEPVENNAEVVTSHVNELIPGILYRIDSGMYLSSAKDAKVDMKAEYIDGTFEICTWGSCNPISSDKPSTDYTNKDILSSKDEPLDIHEKLKNKDEIITIKLKLTAQYSGDPTSAVSCTVIMTTDPSLSGIDGIEAENNAPVKTYNIGGRAANGNGLVIIKQGNTVKKVVR